MQRRNPKSARPAKRTEPHSEKTPEEALETLRTTNPDAFANLQRLADWAANNPFRIGATEPLRDGSQDLRDLCEQLLFARRLRLATLIDFAAGRLNAQVGNRCGDNTRVRKGLEQRSSQIRERLLRWLNLEYQAIRAAKEIRSLGGSPDPIPYEDAWNRRYWADRSASQIRTSILDDPSPECRAIELHEMCLQALRIADPALVVWIDQLVDRWTLTAVTGRDLRQLFRDFAIKRHRDDPRRDKRFALHAYIRELAQKLLPQHGRSTAAVIQRNQDVQAQAKALNDGRPYSLQNIRKIIGPRSAK